MVIITVSQRPVQSISPQTVLLTALWAEINNIVFEALRGRKRRPPVARHDITQRFSEWREGELTNGDTFHVCVDLMVAVPAHHTMDTLVDAITVRVKALVGEGISGVIMVRVIPAAVRRV